jgi:Phytanoyl-CoA dioxygenase (PhyH)
MSVNLPVSSGNPVALRVAAATSQHGKFGVAQRMHTHVGQGATALVPGSHRKVQAIEERWHQKWGLEGQGQRSKEEKLLAAADLEPFERCGLTPCVTNIKAGDCVLFDTALFHGAYAAEDPTGKSGNGPHQLLRAIYILGMSFSRLQTPTILEARRKAYELDVFWPPTIGHAALAQHIVAGKLDGQYAPSLRVGPRPSEVAEGTLEKALELTLAGRQDTRGEVFPRIREFAKAEPAVQRLIDPTYREAGKL